MRAEDVERKRKKEQRVAEEMIRLYCRKKHGGRELCPDCRALADYARQRSKKCPFMESKTYFVR